MADDRTLKPKSFRIDEETAEKFRQITGQLGGNQQTAMAKLIEAYEFQAGKAVLAEKKADIDQFERYVTAITRMYMGSLEANQNITETVRTEFDAQLKSKDATIRDLQERLTAATQVKNDALVKMEAATKESERLTAEINTMQQDYDSKIDSLRHMLADKDSLNKALADSCSELKNKCDDLKKFAEQVEVYKQTAEAEKIKSADLKSEIETLNRQISENQVSHERDLLAVAKEHQAEIDSYQKKYLELLEQIKNSNTNNNLSEQQ